MRSSVRIAVAMVSAVALVSCSRSEGRSVVAARSKPTSSVQPTQTARPDEDISTREASSPSENGGNASPSAPEQANETTTSSAPDSSALIAIGTGLDHEGGLYIVHRDGTGLRKISHGMEQAHSPAWSPDGRSIAFNGATHVTNGYDPSEGGIYIIDRDGTDQRLLLRDAFGAEWAPDGSWIAFTVSDTQSGQHIDVIRPDGTQRRSVTSSPMSESAPRWSPSGDRIAFIDGNSNISIVRPDGSDRKRLTPLSGGVQGAPAWSPDSRSIAYLARDGASLNTALYVIPVTGGTPRRLSLAVQTTDAVVSWSPDGSSISFVGPDFKIWVIHPDGSGSHAVTERSEGFQESPTWSPDGAEIAHIRWEGQTKNVWVQPVAGGPARRVAKTPQQASSLDYTPAGA